MLNEAFAEDALLKVSLASTTDHFAVPLSASELRNRAFSSYCSVLKPPRYSSGSAPQVASVKKSQDHVKQDGKQMHMERQRTTFLLCRFETGPELATKY